MFHVWPAPLTPKILAGFILGGCLLLTPNLVPAATTDSATLSWTANSESDLAGYNVYQGTTSGSYGPAIDVGNTTIYTAQNLQAGLTYYFATTAYDSSGNESLPSIEVSTLISAPPTDTTSPSVTLTAPSNSSTVSGIVTLTATATDNVGVVGVQFHRNGTNLGAEDITNSYALPWDTTTVGNGTYTLTATARDAAGNTSTSASVTVTVSNPSGPQLLAENFNGGTFGGWTVIDEGATSAPSAWSASTGALIQSSNIYSSTTNPLARPGTYVYYDAGSTWTDYQISLTLRSNDNDALGVMFRYQDAQNYYRFSWDQERNYRRLVKVENGIVTLLAENNNVPYVAGQTYQITVKAQGSTLAVGIDGTPILTVSDTSHLVGTLALYSWGNQGSVFDDIIVTSTTLSSTDTTPPSVTLIAPSNASTVSGMVTVTASASDNVGVEGVQFHLNGTNLGAEDTTNTYSVSWDTTGVAAGQYSLTATARDAAGNSMTATPVSIMVDAPPDATPPSIPGTLTAQVDSSSAISLNWTAATDKVGVTGYEIFRNGGFIATTTTTSYQDANLAPSTIYTYTVRARDAAGNESMPSTSVSATTLALPDTTPPSIPSEITGTMLPTSAVALSWEDSTDNVQVAGYHVMRNNFPLATTITPSYQDSGLFSGFTYTYTVKAYDQAGNTSGLSNPVSLTLPPSTSTLSVSIVGNGMVTSSPTGIRCPSNSCSASYGTGSTVTLTAKPDKRWKFTGWSGACSGPGECVIQLLNNQVVEATFSQGRKGWLKRWWPQN
jgi:fibronectin type 3 domain-containing protein